MNSILKFIKSFFKPNSGPLDKNIIAAKVLDVQKHPNADRLRLVKLDAGDRGVVEPVVCGAFNFGVGDVVALALPGAQIAQNIHDENHKPFILEKAKIRGIESQGMICAAFELGIGPLPASPDASQGGSDKPEIMLLKKSAQPGSQFSTEMIE